MIGWMHLQHFSWYKGSEAERTCGTHCSDLLCHEGGTGAKAVMDTCVGDMETPRAGHEKQGHPKVFRWFQAAVELLASAPEKCLAVRH